MRKSDFPYVPVLVAVAALGGLIYLGTRSSKKVAVQQTTAPGASGDFGSIPAGVDPGRFSDLQARMRARGFQ